MHHLDGTGECVQMVRPGLGARRGEWTGLASNLLAPGLP